MIKIYSVNEARFTHLDILGRTPKDILESELTAFTVIEKTSEAEDTAEFTAVLFHDTPLVDDAFLEELSTKGDGWRIGDGWLKKKGYKGELKIIDDIRAAQITNLGNVAPIYAELRRRSIDAYKKRNILFYDIDSCHIDTTVEIGDGCIIHPMVILRGKTRLGKDCVIFPQTELVDTVVEDCVDIRSSYSLSAKIGSHTTVGPFACLRKGAVIGAYCRVGDFVEIKNSDIGDGTKMAHLAYVGDSTVGQNTNVGCGTVFANYNGKIKQRCTVGSNVFIGANSNLVAPVTVNDGAYIAAGSTVTHDVPGGNLCIARSRQVLKENWERK
ncbi:MAG: DapH/DapD/GlmU-related protein [Clostridia bacterium]|nr:DapH/DapD/GlmU-related protein [Clostridia bacterium]